MEFIDVMNWLIDMRSYIAGFIIGLLIFVASLHAVLYKRDTRATMGWVGVILLSPIIGATLYLLLGINRIKRKASKIRSAQARIPHHESAVPISTEKLREKLPLEQSHLASLHQLVSRVSPLPLLPGNKITPLIEGDQAFPAMIKAIESAKKSISMATYIFDDDRAGSDFRDALKNARKRGVKVRVLIDAVGSRYSFPPIHTKLQKDGLYVARFLPTMVPWRLRYMNLRNHRKLLVVDGKIGFTGGMNIREGHMLALKPKHPVKDTHFKIEGPVVTHLQEAFAEDWSFSTGEVLDGSIWFPPLQSVGESLARGIPDGPDEDFEKLYWTIHGALASAKSSVRIATPYFLPDDPLLTAISVATMRGIEVELLLPEKSNLAMVQWASRDSLLQLLHKGCKVYALPGPFDHSKLMVVDRFWSLFGSANWDQRSLRLNFEFNIECYDPKFSATIDDLIQEKIKQSKPITIQQLEARDLPTRVRDGVLRLLTPYL